MTTTPLQSAAKGVPIAHGTDAHGFCYLVNSIDYSVFGMRVSRNLIYWKTETVALNINKHTRKIDVSQETYDRLQQRAVAFEDTPESVIVKLLDESEAQGHAPTGRPRGKADGEDDPEIDIAVDDPFNPPSLKHTKVLRAEVDGRDVVKANWTRVRQTVVTRAVHQEGYNLRRLLQVCPINAVDTPKNDEGYTCYGDLGVSIQGQDANHAWRATAALARALGVHVRVWFLWRTKPAAEHPGKLGLLTVS